MVRLVAPGYKPRRLTLVALVFAVGGIAACGPATPATSAKSPAGSPTAAQASPSGSPLPGGLAPNDCTAPPPTDGTNVHSSALAATVTLPVGWSEIIDNEGQHGMQTAMDLATGSGTDQANIGAFPLSLTMSPHDAVNWMISQPASGSVVARGDCTIAGGKAAFFESTVALPGAFNDVGYSVVMAHGQTLVYLAIIVPVDRAGVLMPQVRRILGSWQWDP